MVGAADAAEDRTVSSRGGFGDILVLLGGVANDFDTEPATFRSGKPQVQSFRFRPKRCARPDWN